MRNLCLCLMVGFGVLMGANEAVSADEATAGSNLIRQETQLSLDEVKMALEAAAKEKGYGVAAVHDLPAMMAKRGVEFARKVFVFEICHPEQAKAVLSERIDAATLLPCRISVWVEGNKVVVATVKPTVLLATLGGAERLLQNAAQVEKDLADIIHAATGSPATKGAGGIR